METENQINLPDIMKDRKKLPEEIKQKIMNGVFFNCLLFMIMMAITIVINMSFDKLYIKDFDSYIDMIQVFCGIISVFVLEVAYRKDSGKIGIYGIEFLIYSIFVLFVPYMYISKSNIGFLKYAIIGFAIYYIAKSVGEFLYMRHSYLKENMSDVKEIVKREKESYIDEESTKTLKEQKLENEKKQKIKEEKGKKKALKKSGGSK